MNRNPGRQDDLPERFFTHPAGRMLAWAYAVVFVIWYFSFTLPNSHIPRSQVWLWALGLLPDMAPPLGGAIRELVGSPYLGQRAFPLAWGLATLLTAWSIGFLCWAALRRWLKLPQPDRVTRAVLYHAVGTVFMANATLLAGLSGMLWPWLFRAIMAVSLAAGLVVAVLQGQATPKEARASEGKALMSPWKRVAWLVAATVAGFALVLTLAGALLPATDFDVREYHLQGPKEYFLAGRIGFLEHNVYTNMPFGTEMLSLFAMVVSGDWWWGALAGQFVLASYPVMTAIAVVALARAAFGDGAMPWALLIAASTPWFYRLATIPYAEGGYCFFTAVAALALAGLLKRGPWTGRERTWALLAGWAAGAAFGTKYTAALFVVLPVCAVLLAIAWQHRSLQSFGLGLAALAIAGGLWPLKNVLLTGNPVYPLAYELFGGRNWNAEKDRKWDRGHTVPGYRLRQLQQNVIDVTAKSDWQSALVFAFAPAALLLSNRRRYAVSLWLAVLYVFACWWLATHRIDRFWLPLLPVACALAAGGMAALARDGWRAACLLALAGAVAYFNLSLMASPLSGNNAYGMPLDDRLRDPLNTATGAVVKYCNVRLLPTARVLSVGAADLFHLDRGYAYNTVFDDCLFEQWTAGLQPPDAVAALRRRGFTHLFICWEEIDRYRKTYGYTDYVNVGLLRAYEKAGAVEVEYAYPDPIEIDGVLVPRGVLYRLK